MRISQHKYYYYLETLFIILVYIVITHINFIIFNELGFHPMPICIGIALALVVSYYHGIKAAPTIAIATALANNFSLNGAWDFALCIAIVNTLGAEFAAYLLRKRVSTHSIFKNFSNFCICFFYAIILAPIITAFGGVLSKYLLGLMPLNEFIISFSRWTMSHSLGTLFFASPVFIFFMNPKSEVIKKDYKAHVNSKIEYTVIKIFIMFSIIFWIGDTIFEMLWLPQRGRNFWDFFLPINDLNEIYMRIVVMMSILICGFAVFKVIQILINQQNKAISLAQDLSTTLDSIGDGVISTDKKGIITRLNPIAEKLTGWDSSEAIGKVINEVFILKNTVTGEYIFSPIQEVLKTKSNQTLPQNIILVSKYGEEFIISEYAAPIISETEDLVGAILVFRDITEEIEIQKRLKHSQRMDAIGQLAGGVAHDFNNMLGGIIGFAELLSKKTENNKELTLYVEMIIDTSEKAAGLTKKLLAFAKKTNIPSTSVDIHTIIADSVELLKRTIDKRIDLITNFKAIKNFVVGDPSQLQNIFINMGINAGYAMNKGGSISFSTQNITIDEDYMSNNELTIKSGEYIEIKISDTGCGIKKENLNKIFEPFFTTRENNKGTGLGLSAVYGTVQQHKGEITVSSTLGQGTTFTIILPVTSEKKHIDSHPDLKSQHGTGNILVVDDEYIMRLTATRILEDYGYKVTSACDGIEAIKLFKSSPDNYNIILLDMIMPGMNGRDCFTELKKIKNDVKVILASGFSKSDDIKSMKKAGLCNFISKPYRSSELIEIISQII